jgi:uncharacterized protein YkwD
MKEKRIAWSRTVAFHLVASTCAAVLAWGCEGEIRLDQTEEICGDGLAEGQEVCDAEDLRDETCESLGFSGGTLACGGGCDGFDTSGCTGTGPECGDGTAEGIEACDGSDLRGEDCLSQGFAGGTLACNATCDGFDTSGCTGTGPECGDGTAEGIEACDGSDLRGEDCLSQGFAGGTLACNATCDGFDTSSCESSSCGNGTVEGGEVCDGADLNGEDCVSQGFVGGTLACNATCAGFDTSGCTMSVCGNDNVEGSEVCDGADLNGEDCVSQGYTGGTLACNASCTGFDISGCGASEAEIVCNRWNTDRMDMSEGTWSGSVAACDPGDISATGRENALKMVNLYRYLADLPQVTTNASRNTATQACALMMDANNALSHSPPTSWDCYTSEGAGAAGSSNIATAPGVAAVDMYMIDWGNSSTLGHRRWILSNSLGSIGLGSTSSYSCMWVIGTGGSANAAWTAWPPPGVVPDGVFDSMWSYSIDDTGWSVQSDSIGLSNAQVTISDGAQTLPVTVSSLLANYGSGSAISIIPDGWTTQPGTTYTVEVTNISTPIAYDVEVVDCSQY